MYQNVQLGKNDFFGKSIGDMIKKVGSATEGINYYVRLDRFDKKPHGLKEFCIKTEQFIPKEKQRDVISTIATLDGLVRGLYSIPQSWLYGKNFKHPFRFI